MPHGVGASGGWEVTGSASLLLWQPQAPCGHCGCECRSPGAWGGVPGTAGFQAQVYTESGLRNRAKRCQYWDLAASTGLALRSAEEDAVDSMGLLPSWCSGWGSTRFEGAVDLRLVLAPLLTWGESVNLWTCCLICSGADTLLSVVGWISQADVLPSAWKGLG